MHLLSFCLLKLISYAMLFLDNHLDHDTGSRRSGFSPHHEQSSPADLPEDTSHGHSNNNSPRSLTSPASQSSLHRTPSPRTSSNHSLQGRSRSHTPDRHSVSPLLNQRSITSHSLTDPGDGHESISDLDDDDEVIKHSGRGQKGSSRRDRGSNSRSSMIVERDTDRDGKLAWDTGLSHSGNSRQQLLHAPSYKHNMKEIQSSAPFGAGSVASSMAGPGSSVKSSNVDRRRGAQDNQNRHLHPSGSSFDLHSSGEVDIPEIDYIDSDPAHAEGPLTAEDLYNKLKRGFEGSSNNNRRSSTESSSKHEALWGVLQPKSSTLRLDPAVRINLNCLVFVYSLFVHF